MLQKEIINGFRKPARKNAKMLLKMTISNLRDIWSILVLIEIGQAKSDIRWYSIDILQLPNVYATPYFFLKKVMHLLNATGKILTCQNLNLI